MITRAAHRNLVYLHKSANTPRKKDVIHSKGSIQYTPKGVFSATLFLWIQVLHCFLLIFFNFFSYLYITVQVHYSLSRGKEKDWSLALPKGWLPKLVLFQKQPFDFLCLYYYNHYRKLKNQTGNGVAFILFLFNTSFHMACLNKNIFGLSSLVGAILPGCRECW